MKHANNQSKPAQVGARDTPRPFAAIETKPEHIPTDLDQLLSGIEAQVSAIRSRYAQPAPVENLVPAKEAARRTNLSCKTVLRWCRTYGCGRKVGPKWQVSISALLAQRPLGDHL